MEDNFASYRNSLKILFILGAPVKSVKCLMLDFSSGHDLTVEKQLHIALDSMLSTEPA